MFEPLKFYCPFIGTAYDLSLGGQPLCTVSDWLTAKVSTVSDWLTAKVSTVSDWLTAKVSTVSDWLTAKVSTVSDWLTAKVSKLITLHAATTQNNVYRVCYTWP